MYEMFTIIMKKKTLCSPQIDILNAAKTNQFPKLIIVSLLLPGISPEFVQFKNNERSPNLSKLFRNIN